VCACVFVLVGGCCGSLGFVDVCWCLFVCVGECVCVGLCVCALVVCVCNSVGASSFVRLDPSMMT
jgi:hypothetical protein